MAHAYRLPKAPLPDRVETVEIDELFTFIKTKNNLRRYVCGSRDALRHELVGHCRAQR